MTPCAEGNNVLQSLLWVCRRIRFVVGVRGLHLAQQ